MRLPRLGVLNALAIGVVFAGAGRERTDDLILSPCYETMSLQGCLVGRDGIVVPFKANARHIRNVKQSVTNFIGLL